ncbi:MAG: biopolymer transporter ExbD [Bacteroidota bacterium]
MTSQAIPPPLPVKKKKRKRRAAVRIDMTPLVDVGFQLITFFMLTTTFSLPQVMEINLPPSESKGEITEASLLLLRVTEGGSIYWNFGTDPPRLIAWEELRGFLTERSLANPNMITLIKVDRKSKYSSMVRMIDELNLTKVNRFSIAPLLEQDLKIIAEAEL